MKKALVGAQNRGVNIFFYTRLEADNHKSWEEIENLGIIPKFVKNLHAKLYYNESSGIITSMNLLVSSNLNAIEFGVLHNTKEDLLDLKSFVKNFLEPYVEHEKPSDAEMYLTKEKFINILVSELSHELKKNVYCNWDKNCYRLQAKNQFYFGIDKVKNIFWITAIASGVEEQNAHIFIRENKIEDLADFQIGNGAISVAFEKPLSTSFIEKLRVNEKQKLLEYIINFVLNWLDFKVYCRGLKFSTED